MDDIPQDVLYEAHCAAERGPAEASAFLRVVAGHFADRAERLRSLRKKGWQTANRELDGVADHIRAYADQLETFAANNPSGVSLVGDDETRWEDPRDTTGGKTDKAKPQLPGNTGRCASFRRATPDDAMICARERGHADYHIGYAADGSEEAWDRVPSGAVCGDVVILFDGTALNCARPLGHDGDEHHDGRYRFWPRGVGTSRQTDICERCNTDTHTCPGCGEPIGHYAGDCGHDCTGDPALRPMTPTELDDAAAIEHPAAEPVAPADIFPGQCTDMNDGERCMLPGGHTGRHKGTAGTAWVQVVSIGDDPRGIVTVTEPAATLGDIAEQQRATMVIPEQRAESDPVPAVVYMNSAAVADTVLASTPAAVLVAEMKEEVSATVAEMTGDEPAPRVLQNVEIREISIVSNPLPQLAFTPENGYSVTPVLGNPFAKPVTAEFTLPASADGGISAVLGNPFQAPAPPPAAFLPPHMVPGAPKAHQSHSSITTMEKCGLQYRLKYRDGIGDDTPAWWNVAGTAFHTVVQAIEAAHADGTPMWAPDAELMPQEREAAATWKAMFATLVERTERETGKARSTWKAAKGGKEGEAFWREYGGDLARMYVGHRRKFLAEPEGWRLLSKPGGEGWAHEVEFNATVDGVLLRGFIDAAWISADGMTILIEDFKSGSSEGDPFQPKLYGAALRALGFIDGRRVVTRFYEARKGAHSATVELTSADNAEVSYRANTAQQMDRAGIFPPNPSGYNCSTCPVKSRCPIMATKGN